MATTAQREHMFALGDYFTFPSVKSQIRYLQERPENDLMYFGPGGEQKMANYFAAGGVISLDCSALQTLVFELAGCHDPTGFGYNGYGNSNSMWDLLGAKAYTDPKRAEIGALVVFGTFNADGTAKTVHVASVHIPDTVDPVLLSHGSAAGPEYVQLHDFALGDYRFLPVSTL